MSRTILCILILNNCLNASLTKYASTEKEQHYYSVEYAVLLLFHSSISLFIETASDLEPMEFLKF